MRRLLWPVLLLIIGCPGPIDTDPPLVVIIEPEDNSTVQKGMVEITATATDESGVIRVVDFFVDNRWLNSDSTLPSPYSVLWNTKDLDSGSQHRIRVEAQDGAGNVGSDSVLVSIATSVRRGADK